LRLFTNNIVSIFDQWITCKLPLLFFYIRISALIVGFSFVIFVPVSIYNLFRADVTEVGIVMRLASLVNIVNDKEILKN